MESSSPKNRSILVAYASEGGNSKSLAEDFAKRCQSLSLRVELFPLNALVEKDFAKSFVIYFVSTTGNGEFPANGRQFVDYFNSSEQTFDSLNYALFALGNRSYSQFCGAGKALLDALQTKQACSLHSPVFAADDFDQLYAPWALAVLAELTGLSLEGLESELDEFSKKPKASYQLLDRQCLTKERAEQQTYHLVLDPEEGGVQYMPGDVVSITPDNVSSKVNELIEVLQLPLDSQVKQGGVLFDLQTFLTTKVELTKINAALIKKTGAILSDWRLLTQASNAKKLQEMESQFDVYHWFQTYPIPMEHRIEWLSSLPVKAPRYYSVASESVLVENQLHLTVGLHQQVFQNETDVYYGLGSGALCRELGVGESVELSLEVHPNFHLQLEKPMIWVATGTGIAPFIGFLMQLSQIFPDSRPDITLYFGVRHPDEDFLYQAFLESCHEKGLIDLRMVFSRVEDKKQYVQHVMTQDIEKIADCTKKDGHVYVCGGTSMWEEVEVVLQHAILESCDSMEDAKGLWLKFIESRLHKDVY